MPGGRPLKFKTPKELQEKIDNYFSTRIDEDGNFLKPITITGLALHLDTTRETLCRYEEKDQFTDTLKKAKLMVENFYEEQLMGKSVTGAIFALKNFDWNDTQTLKGDPSAPITTQALPPLTPEQVAALSDELESKY